MKEEAPHELGDRHPYDFALMTATLPVVLPAEANDRVVLLPEGAGAR